MGEPLWHFGGLSGYNHAHEMGRLGHVSLTLDLLGYGRSGIPNGLHTCIGSDADVTHQITEQLHTGKYTVSGGRTKSFRRVALAGLSGGAYRGVTAVASFEGVDALVAMGAAIDNPHPVNAGLTIARTTALVDCPLGTKPKAKAGDPGGYYDPRMADNQELLFASADEHVRQAVLAAEERDPCGLLMSELPFMWGELKADVDVPVLVMFGQHDALWNEDAADKERTSYTSSGDVTALTVDGAGHLLMFEKQAPAFRLLLSQWLRERGL